jgi:hypothetical protein
VLLLLLLLLLLLPLLLAGYDDCRLGALFVDR